MRAAAKYLGCSKEELLAWIEPDRRLPSGTPLWLRRTLDRARPLVDAWRERDRVATEARARERAAQHELLRAERAMQAARRAGMRKRGAILAGKVCEQLECSLTELNRWAADGRLPPDGEIVLFGLPKMVHARAWLPETIERAKAARDDWRAQDRAKKAFKRRGLRAVT
ncbi:MAG: hypothetical protein J2P47_06115 [Acetobacteraceae bacterium]|nr:hypothetical protein [Acetobacteraceae bacterium]